MGRKLDPTNKVKRGPGKKAKKQQGAETELVKFITDGDYYALCANYWIEHFCSNLYHNVQNQNFTLINIIGSSVCRGVWTKTSLKESQDQVRG